MSGTHPVLARDIKIADNKKKLKFILRTSKTHWTNSKPQIIKINSTDFGNYHNSLHPNNAVIKQEEKYCPYMMLQRYLKIRGGFNAVDEPFFIFKDKSPVTPEQARNVLKKVLSLAGFQAECYNFQSLRAGQSCDLHSYGLSIESLKSIGRWRSNVVYTYLLN